MLSKYDSVVIGAGMSGMACALRLGMFGKKVLLLEKHSVPGGLNSYFQRVKFENNKRLGIRKFDVGLHALTNFARKGEKNKPLLKICKQLRISLKDLNLKEQSGSRVIVDNENFKFSNDIKVLISEVESKYPEYLSAFEELISFVENYDDSKFEKDFVSARNFLESKFSNQRFIDLILYPLLCYGSSWENDIDLIQFVILFKSLYLEGFSRPLGGVRTIIDLISQKLKDNNVDVLFKKEVTKLCSKENQVKVEMNCGNIIHTNRVYSSVGLPETEVLLNKKQESAAGSFSFVECIVLFKSKIKKEVSNDTIVFYSGHEKMIYGNPKELVDYKSAIICIPDNYEENEYTEGHIRITFMANYSLWNNLDAKDYDNKKKEVYSKTLELIKKLYPNDDRVPVYHDVFTPLTIKKFTSHQKGAVYGSSEKRRDGDLGLENIHLIGTDQGYLGVVGSLLSGISMANYHGFEA